MTDPNRRTVEPLERQNNRSLESKGRNAVAKKIETLKVLNIEYVAPDSIYPNAYNPNRQTERDFELLLSSMTEDGFTQPILVDKRTKEIIDGEHRWRAAQRLGLKEIPVVFTDMTPEQMRISTLRHNRARGSEDIELTIEILKDLRELGALEHAVDSLGMSDKEINALIEDLPAPEKQASEEFAKAWVVDVPDVDEHFDDKKNQLVATSQSLHIAQKRLQLKLEQVPADDEEKRQVILKEETSWHSVIIQIPFNKKELVDNLLSVDPAHSLLQLCRYHMVKIGKPMQEDDYWTTQFKDKK